MNLTARSVQNTSPIPEPDYLDSVYFYVKFRHFSSRYTNTFSNFKHVICFEWVVLTIDFLSAEQNKSKY